MALFARPYISPLHYDFVRNILNGDLPATHDEWMRIYIAKLGALKRDGHQYKEVPIDPDELAQFCNAHPHRRDHDGLDYFASQKVDG